MAQSRCSQPDCSGTRFELVEADLGLANYRLIQCSRCGTVVGAAQVLRPFFQHLEEEIINLTKGIRNLEDQVKKNMGK